MKFIAKLFGLKIVELNEVPFEPTMVDGKVPLVKIKNLAIIA